MPILCVTDHNFHVCTLTPIVEHAGLEDMCLCNELRLFEFTY